MNAADGVGRGAGDDGFTLIEALIAIAIIGVGLVAVVAAMQFGFESARLQQGAATGESALRSAAEQVKAASYGDCASSYAVTAQAGVSVDAGDVEFWDGNTDPAEFSTSCPSDDPGVQKITIEVQVDGGETYSTEVVKRRDP